MALAEANLEQRIRPQPKGLGSVNGRMSCPIEELAKASAFHHVFAFPIQAAGAELLKETLGLGQSCLGSVFAMWPTKRSGLEAPWPRT